MDMSELREEIDTIDDQLVKLFGQRMDVAAQIAAYKKEMGLPIRDFARESALLEKNRKYIASPEIEDYYADIVILADGVNSLLAKSIGLRNEIETKDVASSVKEVIQLNKEKINARFHVYEDEGDHVPHMHLIKEGEPDCCIRIDKAEYFSHGRHSNTINSKTLKRFINFMKSKNIKFGQSNYKFAIYSWNKYNKHDQLDMNMDMPDYSKLNKI